MGPAQLPSDPEPLFRVVAGDPSPEELAALTAVLASRLIARPRPAPRTRSAGWADRSRLLRTPLTPGPGAWRRCTQPR